MVTFGNKANKSAAIERSQRGGGLGRGGVEMTSSNSKEVK